MKILYMDYMHGGLKMIDVSSFTTTIVFLINSATRCEYILQVIRFLEGYGHNVQYRYFWKVKKKRRRSWILWWQMKLTGDALAGKNRYISTSTIRLYQL